MDVYHDTLTQIMHHRAFPLACLFKFENSPSCFFATPVPEFRATSTTRFHRRIHPDLRASRHGPSKYRCTRVGLGGMR